MSRFAVDPRWLIYLPPTMSPAAASAREGVLEHPEDAFEYYASRGVTELVCEEKHMGSRAVVVLCRTRESGARRFGESRMGVVYTRTGRPFFADDGLERALLERLSAAMEKSALWDRLETDWVCLDAELLPWSAKAQELLRTQYAPVGASAVHALDASIAALRAAAARVDEAKALLGRYEERLDTLRRYRESYRRYCWPVAGLDDLRLAPFHLLAAEGRVFDDRPHAFHLEMLDALCEAGPELLRATARRFVRLDDPASVTAAATWWEEITEAGAEGMVVKPATFLARGKRGLLQPALKCRGREYLRIIYGPEYTLPEHLERLRTRSLGRKRSLALGELALGLEALHRFVEREPLYRVHECAFGVLALESDPVDPRL